jgi:hypothetical protein
MGWGTMEIGFTTGGSIEGQVARRDADPPRPILIGDGTRLFEDLDPEGIELRRTSTIETPGATHFRFEVVK